MSRTLPLFPPEPWDNRGAPVVSPLIRREAMCLGIRMGGGLTCPPSHTIRARIEGIFGPPTPCLRRKLGLDPSSMLWYAVSEVIRCIPADTPGAMPAAHKMADLSPEEFLRDRIKQTHQDQAKARRNGSWTAVKDLGRDLVILHEKLQALKPPEAPELSDEDAWEQLVAALADMDLVEFNALMGEVAGRRGLRVVG